MYFVSFRKCFYVPGCEWFFKVHLELLKAQRTAAIVEEQVFVVVFEIVKTKREKKN